MAFSSISVVQGQQASAESQESEQASKPAKMQPTNPEILQARSAKAYKEGNWVQLYAANMQLHQQRPYVPEYMYNIVIAAAQLDRKSTAYHYMMQMQQQGLSYDFNQTEDTLKIRNTEAYNYINKLMVDAAQPAGDGEVIFSLKGKPGDFSDIAWDAGRERFLLGTRREGKLLAVSAEGESEVLLQANEENGLWSINGIAVDEANNRLWLASAATPVYYEYTPAVLNRGALFEYELDSLKQVGRYNLPVDGQVHELGHVAVTASGDVYAIDWASPFIYRKTSDSDKVEVFAGGGQLAHLTDIAVTPDSSRVFVADALMGVLLIDPESQHSAMLGGPENLNLGGIYGIEFKAGQLFITQSGISPQRLMRLDMNSAGTMVDAVAPMAIALESFDRPGAGTIVGDNLAYLANQGSDREDGPLKVMQTPLAGGSEIKAPELPQLEETRKVRVNP
jgi:hypothetical protein